MGHHKDKTTDAITILKNRITKGDPARLKKLEKELEKEKMALKIGQVVYDMRKKAGLTQQELADKIGTKKSSISRLEDANYGGHSISMLLKIAIAVDSRLEIKFVDIKKSRKKTTRKKVNSRAYA